MGATACIPPTPHPKPTATRLCYDKAGCGTVCLPSLPLAHMHMQHTHTELRHVKVLAGAWLCGYLRPRPERGNTPLPGARQRCTGCSQPPLCSGSERQCYKIPAPANSPPPVRLKGGWGGGMDWCHRAQKLWKVKKKKEREKGREGK